MVVHFYFKGGYMEATSQRDDREVRRLISSANMFIGLSWFGLIFPLLGWIFAGIAINKANQILMIIEDDEKLHNKYYERKKYINNTAGFLIVIYIFCAIAWTSFLINSANQRNEEQQVQQPTTYYQTQ